MSQCACRVHAKKPAPTHDPFDTAQAPPGPWFLAEHPGYCDTCGTMFIEGDSIRADGSGGWEAKECCGV